MTAEQQARAIELSAAHWTYIEALLQAHGTPENDVRLIGFHYRSALVHGYGHGVEDANDLSEGSNED